MGVARTDRLRNHWRPEAPDYLTWHLLFDDGPGLDTVAATLQQVLEGIDGIDVVPTRWLHLTVQARRSVDDVVKKSRGPRRARPSSDWPSCSQSS